MPANFFLWDPRAIVAVQHVFGPGWLAPFRALTELGNTWAIVVVVAIARWVRGRRLAYSLLAVVLLGAAASTALKALVGLPRPHDTGIVIREAVNDGSFPSGHSVTAATLWGGLTRLDRLPWVLAGLLVGAVMLSRVYLGVHYPGDVLGGAALGLLLVAGYGRLLPGLAGRIARRPSRRLVVALGALLLGGTLAASPFLAPSVRTWQVVGGLAGAAVAIPLDVLWGPAPAPPSGLAARARVLAIGLGGLALLLGADVVVARWSPPLAGVTLALAALWVAPGVPRLTARPVAPAAPARPERPGQEPPG